MYANDSASAVFMQLTDMATVIENFCHFYFNDYTNNYLGTINVEFVNES